MTDEAKADGEGFSETATDANVPTWTGTPVSGAPLDDEMLTAGRWIEAVEGTPIRAQPQPESESESEPQPGFEPDLEPAPLPGGVAQPSGRRRFRVLVVATAVLLAGVVGWALGRAVNVPSETEQDDTALVSTAQAGENAGDGAASSGEAESAPLPDEGATTSTEPTPGPGTEPEADEGAPFVVPETPDNPLGATQYAVMADGQAVMRGWYPTEEQAEAAVADAAVIMGGPENVLDETEVDPRAEIRPDSFAVYLQDFILFQPDSAEITPEFTEFLGFPLFFMQNSPSATVTVVARTDASGSESYNLELATRRAEAVRDYWLANGGNAEQIILDPRGEEDADDNADDEQAALDRRVELQVSGFLAG